MNMPIASDHAGFDLKGKVIEYLKNTTKIEPVDMGTYSPEPCDFPDYAAKVAKPVSLGQYERGILICGTGQGMCITANRFPEVRATACYSVYEAQMAREHLDSNILVLGARVTEDMGLVGKIIDTWLGTRRSPETKYAERIAKIESLTKERW